MIEGNYTKERDIEATFKHLESNLPTISIVKFGRKESYFPVEVWHKFQLNEKWIAYSLAEVSWEHRSDYSLPSNVVYTEFGLYKGSSKMQLDVTFDWKVGEQVTRRLNHQLDDWRQPFKELFDTEWQEANRMAPGLK